MIRKRLIPAAAALAACLLAVPTAAFAQEEEPAPRPVPNRIKYQDSKPNAKGTGQLASVEVLALLSQNGMAQLEVTTGSLDTGEPSSTANITKVQLKINSVTTNFNNLDGGSFTLPLTDVQRYTPFQAHVSVKDLNGGNTEVVQVDDMVRRRPDLTIVSADGPGAVRVNQPFTIVATIRELNGDTGARTSCVLEEQNRGEIDRADGIWVDAGDSVQCMFSQTLDSLGKHIYFVRLVNTQPADWDSRFELQGLIVQGTTDKQWELTAAQRTIRETYVETSSGDPGHPTSGESTTISDAMHFNAVIAEPLDLETLNMALDETTDGKRITRFEGGFPPATQCILSDRRSSVYHICRFEGGLAMDAISIGSNALYVSRFWTQRYDPASGENVYTLRSINMTARFGPFQRYGSTYSLHIALSDANGHWWEVSPFINLVPYENPVVYNTRYREYAGYTYRTDTTYQETGKKGYASQE
jgi:hypothetical protein